MAAPAPPTAIAARTRKTRVRMVSLRSTSPIHARSPSSDIVLNLEPAPEPCAPDPLPCGPHFRPPLEGDDPHARGSNRRHHPHADWPCLQGLVGPAAPGGDG